MGGPAATPVGKGRPAPYAAGKGKGSQGKDDGKGKDQDGKGKGSAGRFTRGGKDKGKNTGWRVHEVVDAWLCGRREGLEGGLAAWGNDVPRRRPFTRFPHLSIHHHTHTPS